MLRELPPRVMARGPDAHLDTRLLEALRDPLTPPALRLTLSSETHILLLAPEGAPFPVNTTASLGGVPATVNWRSPDGALLSLTTPALEQLCPELAQGVAPEAGAGGRSPADDSISQGRHSKVKPSRKQQTKKAVSAA
jgi:hypothetical protein